MMGRGLAELKRGFAALMPPGQEAGHNVSSTADTRTPRAVLPPVQLEGEKKWQRWGWPGSGQSKELPCPSRELWQMCFAHRAVAKHKDCSEATLRALGAFSSTPLFIYSCVTSCSGTKNQSS